jgi:4-hydroxy-tetrahydrodipicolinate synthase
LSTVSSACDPAKASTFVISITPFGEDGAFDEAAIRSHLRRLANSGIGVYLGGGGSGEGYVLTDAETQRLLEIGVEEIKGKVPVRSMGIEPRTAQEMIDFVSMAKKSGIDATQIYSLDQGHGHLPTAKEIRTYFEDVLSAIDVPAIISTHKSVGYQVPVEMLVDLVERYDVIGINCSHPDMRYLARIVDAVGNDVEVHVGGPYDALTAWCLGATGYLSSEGNFAPELCMSVVRAYQAGDGIALTVNFGKLLRIAAAFRSAGGIRATKSVLTRLGLAGGTVRKPQLGISPEAVDELIALAESLDVLPFPT